MGTLGMVLKSTAALGADFFTEAVRGEELEWQKGGLCNNMDPEFFFPEGRGNANQTKIAKRICLECPIMKECRDWALSKGEQFGVWGGTSDKERRAIWKKWNNQLR